MFLLRFSWSCGQSGSLVVRMIMNVGVVTLSAKEQIPSKWEICVPTDFYRAWAIFRVKNISFKFSARVFKSVYSGRYWLKLWMPSKHIPYRLIVNFSGRLWGRFPAWPWKSQCRKMFMTFWAKNLSTGNSGQGSPPNSDFIYFVRKHTYVLLFRILLFANAPTRKTGVSVEFLFLKYTTVFN